MASVKLPMNRRTLVIYGTLGAIWCLMMGWMAAEHYRVARSAQAALRNRAKDISSTVGIVVRSQRHFGGVISRERLESALKELIKPGELNAIALLSASGEVVATAGAAIPTQPMGELRPAELWEDQTVTLLNLVDLGTNVTRDLDGPTPTIVMSRQEFPRPDTNRPAGPPPEFRPPPRERDTNLASGTNSTDATNANWNRPRGPGGRSRFARPFWMSEPEYKAMIQKQGVHSFLVVLSTQAARQVIRQDFWLRVIIGILGTISVVGSGLAWRNLAKSSDLQIRLVRASELTTHLKQMNLAAAGLAHETRNPLNIIRGLAQMISKQEDSTPEVRQKSREIIEETDRVTAQLNEFINYSRPREVRRSAVTLGPVVGEVVRTLSGDLEEKNMRLQVLDGQLTIDADEQLLRQALFNLILNAIQAGEPGGEIQVVAQKSDGTEAVLEVRDNGPGVPPERRTEVFKPYFTTNQKGTGLGLAVVQQIVLAHGWEVACLANQPRGAVFRLSHLRLAG